MVVGEVSKPKHSADVSITQEVESMERMPKSQWSLDSTVDKSSCAVPVMLYRDVLKSNSECSSVNIAQKFSSPTSHNLLSEFDLETKDAEYSSSSSTATLTSSWENTSTAVNNNKNMIADLEEERSKDNAGDHPSKKSGEAIKVSQSLQHSPPDQHGTQHKQKHQKDFVPYSHAISPLETSSGISISSGGSGSTSSVGSRRFYPDQEKSSKQSGSDSSASSSALSIANFSVSSANITPCLINTAYSRLKDRDMLYKRRIKELESKVKKVPVLEMKLAALKEENRLLLLQLKFCSGKIRSIGTGEAFLYNDQTCDLLNSDSKHLNCSDKSPESFVNSTGFSGISEDRNPKSSKRKTRRETKCHEPLKKTNSEQTETSKLVNLEATNSHVSTHSLEATNNNVSTHSLDATNSHVSTTLCEVKQNCEIKEETNQQNKENVEYEVTKLLDLCSGSLKLDKGSNPSPKFCLKCPRCSFRISDESLEMNLMKDQNVQTDPSIFTYEKSTQTHANEALKSQPLEYFIQHLQKAFSESGLNNSELSTTDQILNILKHISCHISDDSQQGCNSSTSSLGFCQYREKGFFSSESPSVNTSEASTFSNETGSACGHAVKEILHNLARSKKCEVFDPCLSKAQKESSDLRENKVKICSLKIENPDKIEVKNNESFATSKAYDLICSMCRCPQKARTEIRTAVLNSVPTSPFLPSQEERKVAFPGESERQASCLSPISDFADYGPGSVSAENVKNEVIQNMKSETGQSCDNSNLFCNGEVQVITALDCSKGNGLGCGENCNTSGDEYKSSADSSYFTQDSKTRCRSPSLKSEPCSASEMADINLKQESQSQVFDIEDIKDELLFPEEVKDGYKRINDYLLNKRNLEGQNLQEPVDLVKTHWFGITCSPHANPILLQKYLNEISQYSSILPQWVINLHDGFGNTALHFTVANKRLSMLDALLQTGICDVNKRNKAGFTSVMLASAIKLRNDRDRELMKKLLQMSDVNAKSYLNGETALTLASGHGVEDMVELLIEAGADVNAQDNEGSTPLMYAAEQGFVHIAKLLLAHPDCDLSLKDNDGMDACCVALKAGYPNVGLLIYFHGNRKASKKKSGKCKKWLKTSTRNPA